MSTAIRTTLVALVSAGALVAVPTAGAAPTHVIDSPSVLEITEPDDATITLAYRNGTATRHTSCSATVSSAEWVRGYQAAVVDAPDFAAAVAAYRASNPSPAGTYSVLVVPPDPGRESSQTRPYAGPRPAGAFSWCTTAGGSTEVEFALPPEPTGSVDLGSLTGSLESGSLASLETGTTAGS